MKQLDVRRTGRTLGGTGSWLQLWVGTACLLLAAAVWLPLVYLAFRPAAAEFRTHGSVPPLAEKLSARHFRLWNDPAERSKATAVLRACNPEWDLMARGYLVLALANMALREPDRQGEYLPLIDRIIDDTLAAERQHGPLYFLLPYSRARPFVLSPVRSHHVDSQIALMLGARCAVGPRSAYAELLRERVAIMCDRMEASPVLAVESYPDECWMFDIANGLSATRMSDVLLGTDHGPLRERWCEIARQELVDPKTGLLYSSLTVAGDPRDGPEGSTIWMASHALQLIDQEFASDQYARARKELSRTLLGFGYAREWPDSWIGPADVDSGPRIPGLDVSAGSSGTALIAAAAFADEAYLSELFTTLNFAGFPLEQAGALRYCASNELGDAVVLYATVVGPLWDRIEKGGPR